MSMTDHPAWNAYKAALARVAKAGARLTSAQEQDGPDVMKAEQEFHTAITAYDSIRTQMCSEVLPLPEGQEDASHAASLDGAPVTIAMGEAGRSDIKLPFPI